MSTIRKRGARYQARVQRTGFPEQSKTFSSRVDAERWARGIERQIDVGCFAPAAMASHTSLGELLARYRLEVSPIKRGGPMEEIRLAAMERREIAKVGTSALTASIVAKYRDDRLQSVSGATVNRDLDDLSAVLNHARREWGLQILNPVPDVRRPARSRSRGRLLSTDEEGRLIQALDVLGRESNGRFARTARNPWVAPIVQLALLTAMRRGELLSLEWRHINLAQRVAKLPITKNGDTRVVPLSTKAIDVLSTLPRTPDQSLVFPISAMALRKAFERACERAGIADLHFHDLRHTAATRMSQYLPNVIELAAVTGHRDLKMLQRYYHPRAEDLALKLG